jgi:hypothetical protein
MFAVDNFKVVCCFMQCVKVQGCQRILFKPRETSFVSSHHRHSRWNARVNSTAKRPLEPVLRQIISLTCTTHSAILCRDSLETAYARNAIQWLSSSLQWYRACSNRRMPTQYVENNVCTMESSAAICSSNVKGACSASNWWRQRQKYKEFHRFH